MKLLLDPDRKNILLVIIPLFVLNFLIGFPGTFTFDSLSQYNQALAHEYTDWQPPVAAALWSLFMYITKSPAIMLFYNLVLLWGSVYNFAYALKDRGKLHYIFYFVPFLPFILNNSFIIWKDVAFSFSYLLAASVLTKATIQKDGLRYSEIILVFLSLFYGTAVKFIALYVLPIFCLWIALILQSKINFKRTVILCLLLSASIYGSVLGVSKLLVKKENEQHWWQFVKLYDLAGIAIQTNDLSIFPNYVSIHPQFNKENLLKNYNHKMVDHLLSSKTLPEQTKDKKNLDELWNKWFKAVKKYPYQYFKHRFLLWQNILSVRYMIVFSPEETMYNPERYKVKNNSLKRFIHKYLIRFSSIPIQSWLLALIPLYICLGFKTYQKDIDNGAALSLLILNIASLTQILFLFFFSMASDGRYLYLSVLLVNFSHPVAYLCFQQFNKKYFSV